jgi:LCP family protein required for cell wall assembly
MKKKVILWSLISLLVLGGVGTWGMYHYYLSSLDRMTVPNIPYQDENHYEAEPEKPSSGEVREPNQQDATTEKPKPKQTYITKDPFILLLYGVDVRPGAFDVGRPDTMMLAMVDPGKLKVSLVSIPRDSYVNILGQNIKDKINHSYAMGGPSLTIKTIEQWLDRDIYGYVAINFEGFRQLVDLVGGIEVYVDRSIQYNSFDGEINIGLEQGTQILDGKHALDFVRARLDNRGPQYYTSDYLRMERQQRVLGILGNELVSFRSITRLFSIVNILSENISTTLTGKEMDSLIRRFYHFNPSDLETTSVFGTALRINGIWYEEIEAKEVERIQALINDFMKRD